MLCFLAFLPVGYPAGKDQTAPGVRTVNRNMSYDPSTRRLPRQERWPDATPQRGWPAYSNDGAYRDGDLYTGSAGQGHRGYTDALAGTGSHAPAGAGYGDSWDGYPDVARGQTDHGHVGYRQDGYGQDYRGYAQPREGYGWPHNAYNGTVNGYPGAADDFDGAPDRYDDGRAYGFNGAASGPPWVADDYADSRADSRADPRWDGRGETRRGWDGRGEPDRGWDRYAEPDRGWDGRGGADCGYGQVRDEPPDPAGYTRPQPAGPALVAPDLVGDAGWTSGTGRGGDPGRGGFIAAAMTGILAAAVAIGVATLAAAFVGPQASPVAAIGGVLVDRIPAALRTAAAEHLGAHGETVLLFGVIGLLAVVIGCLARRSAAIGVAGLAALGLLGAFVVITRPASHASDVIPSVAGGIVGVIAFAWLARAAAPAAPVAPPLRPAGGRRTAR